MKELLKNKKGITLVALVVTIVVLIILAGVSIALVLGQNGIVNKATEASSKTKVASSEEKVSMLLGEYYTEKTENNKTINDFLTEKKENGEIQDFTDNGDGTTTIKVDGNSVTIDNTKLTINGTETPESLAQLITPAQVKATPKDYYGSEVTGYTCPSDGVSKWRLFYADDTNIYLIADDYISGSKVPNGKNGTVISRYTQYTDYQVHMAGVENDYPGKDWLIGQTDGKDNSKAAAKWLKTYLDAYKGVNTTTENIKIMCYLLDTNVWNVYQGNKADYAIGAPTFDLYCASYKDTHPDKYIKYWVTPNNEDIMQWSDNDSTRNTWVSDIPQDEYDKIYINSDRTKADGYWLACPSEKFQEYVEDTDYSGCIGSAQNSCSGRGLRPVVCLNSSVKLHKTGNRVYEIK